MERYRDLGAHFPHVYGANVKNHETTFWKRHEFSVNFPGGNAGATDAEYRGLIVAPFRMMVVAAYLTSIDGNIGASAVAYKTVTIDNWGRTGTAINVGTVTTVTGLTRYVPKVMTLSTTLTDLIVQRGEILEVDMSVTGGGVAINQCAVTIIAKAIE